MECDYLNHNNGGIDIQLDFCVISNKSLYTLKRYLNKKVVEIVFEL